MSLPVKRLKSKLVVEPERRITKLPSAAQTTPRARHLLKKYGITEDQYDELLRRQEECCFICQRHYSKFKYKLCVDHDHHTGAIRGLLCQFCNRRVIGRHRDADIFERAADYLRRGTDWVVPPKVKRRKKRGRKINHKRWSSVTPCCSHILYEVSWYLSYTTLLDVYTLEQILELNDKTTEECLEYLVEEGYVELPRIKPLDFEWLR